MAADPAALVSKRVSHLLGTELADRWSADEQLAWAGIMEVARLLPARHDREMVDRHGLSLPLLSLLGRLSECGGPTLHARELAVDLRLSPSRVSRHLATLESEGLISRCHSAQDGRALDVTLTEAGRKRLHAARQTAREIVQRDFLSHLEPEQVKTLAEIAERLLRATVSAGVGD